MVSLCISLDRLLKMESNKSEPPKKKTKLCLSLKSRRRFGETSKQEVETMSKAIMPKNTSANTRYQLALFAISTR